MREKLQDLLFKAVQANYFDVDKDEILVSTSDNKKFGDYSTNLAFVISKKTTVPVVKVAADLIRTLEKLNKKEKVFDKVESVNGFINFCLAEEDWQGVLKQILRQGERFGFSNSGKNKKVNIEFISANPTGELHLGNSRGAFFGDTLSNVLATVGYKVTREYFNNNSRQGTQIKNLGLTVLGKGKLYQNPYLKKKVSGLKLKLKGVKDEGKAGYIAAEAIKKDIQKFISKKLKIKFDVWFDEELLYKTGEVQKTLDYLKKQGLVYEKEGAFWIKTSYLGDSQDWVLVRSQGKGPAYFLSDITYYRNKFQRGFNKIINILGPDHQGHVKRMKAIPKIFSYSGESVLIFTQIVRIKERGKLKKFSKREGTTVTLEWLINQVGLDAARFFYLMKSIDTHLEFDVALAKKQTAQNPVFYVQYGHTRLASILRKATQRGLKPNTSNLNLIKHEAELGLIKKLARWPELVEDVAQDFQVHKIPHYLINLADETHSFYEKVRVLTTTGRQTPQEKLSPHDRRLSEARLALIKAAKAVMKNGLNILGINAPERM